MKLVYRLILVLLILVLAGALAAILVASPAGVRALQRGVEAAGRAGSATAASDRQAILLLGGRTARVHDAARLHRATGLPILISGKGTGDSGFRAESEKMQDILRKEYQIEPQGIETESRSTQQNAEFSWCLWGRQGVRRVLLVTDLRHMLRARTAFAMAGFDVVPAVAEQQASPPAEPLTLASFKPSEAGFEAAKAPLKELGGAALAVLERVIEGTPACDAVRGAPPQAAGEGSPGLPPPRE